MRNDKGAVLALRDFDPNQERDENGRWTSGGGSGDAGESGGSAAPSAEGVGPGNRDAVQNRRPPSEPIDTVRSAASSYNAERGLAPIQEGHYVEVDEPRARNIAAAYDAAPSVDRSPETIAAYTALSKEVEEQWRYAEDKMGMTFEAWTKEGQPYASSKEMRNDVAANKHLYFFTGGEPHPYLGAPGPDGLSANDKFRAVHDLFGHSAEGYGFGSRGEENAWLKHSQMFSPAAQRAMTTETRGQNSWVNFGKQNYNADGSPRNLPLTERPYAEQKVMLLPAWVTDWKAVLPKKGVAYALVRCRSGVAYKFEEGQPRDDHGRWTSGGGGGDSIGPGGAAALSDADFFELRGPVESTPGFVYHATNADNARDISTGSLDTHGPSFGTDQEAWPDGSTARRSYWTPTADNTWQFAPEDGKPVLLRAARSVTKFREEGTGDLYATQPIAASKIEYLHANGDWRKLAHDEKRITSFGKDFDPNQARDEDGKWTSGGGGAASSETPALAPVHAVDPSVQNGVLPPVKDRLVANAEAALSKAGYPPEHMAARADELMQYAKERPEIWEEGIGWYQREHDLALELAGSSTTGLTEDSAAAVLAAVSPRQKVEVTEDQAGAIVRAVNDDGTIEVTRERVEATYQRRLAMADGKPELVAAANAQRARELREDLGSHDVLSGDPTIVSRWHENRSRVLTDNWEKGLRIARGELPEDVLGGPKVWSFYDNIRNPSESRSVTIDTWMVKALTSDDISEKDLPKLLGNSSGGRQSTGRYEAFSRRVRESAARYGVSPLQAQSIMWHAIQARSKP